MTLTGTPPLARAVAGAVMDALGRKPSRPVGTVALGDPRLVAVVERADH